MNALTALARSTRAELRRLWRWPATWVLVGVWTVLNLLFAYAFPWIGYSGGGGPDAAAGASPQALLAGLLPANVPSTLVQGMPMFGGAIVMLLGALAIGNGYAWGTWKTVLTQGPGRLAAFGGTLVALAVSVVGIVALTAATDLATAHVVAAVEGGSAAGPAAGDLVQAMAAGLLVLGMWAAGGVLVGALAKGPALAAGLGLVWALVVENLLRGVSGLVDGMATLTDRLPGSAAGSLAGALGAVGQDPRGEGTPGVLTVLDGASAAWLLAAYLVVFAVVALTLVRRRDLG
ncbi:ABC transporter permease subunit [Georgenia ruanii]|uniref:ABC transporter permease subunit n=1 Tax=Georgenia ruanii TaxID=348442 RepID=A0A7J9UXM6_9MICO|nr:ABC transporter permease subunit [Georgenia ruanii]MPV89222.1 ABC transporter permease subunit [Georgenia ruanii]